MDLYLKTQRWRYRHGNRAVKKRMLDEFCETHGSHCGNKVMDNKKTLPTAIVHTHRLLAHIPTRLNNNYFLTETQPLKSNTYSEATTMYFFCPLRQ